MNHSFFNKCLLAGLLLFSFLQPKDSVENQTIEPVTTSSITQKPAIESVEPPEPVAKEPLAEKKIVTEQEDLSSVALVKEEEFSEDSAAFVTQYEDPPDGMIPTKEQLEAGDTDPGNTAGFTAEDAGYSDTPEEIEIPEKDNQGYTAITQEKSDEKTAAKEAEKQAELANQVRREAIKTAEAKQRNEAFSMNLTGLKEAGIDIEKNGFGFTGKFIVWKDAYARLAFAINTDGIFASGKMNQLKVGPLHITGTGPDGIYGTLDDGVIVDVKINHKKQRILISGMIELFNFMSRCDMAVGNKNFQLFTNTKILDAFETKFLAQSKGLDGEPDFLMMGSAEADFLEVLEKIGGKAVSQLGHFTGDGLAKLRKEVEKFRKKTRSLKGNIKGLTTDLKEKRAQYDHQVRKARKALAPIFNLIKYLKKQVRKIKGTIRKERRKAIANREKHLGKVRRAKDKVNKLRNEVNKAKRALSRAKSKTKWYKPWTYAVVAYEATRLAAVEITRWSAEKVLQGIIALMKSWPIDGIPPIPFLWVAYGKFMSELRIAHRSWTSALMLSNPAAIGTYAEMLVIQTKIAVKMTPYLAAQAGLLSAKATLFAAEKTMRAAGDIAAEVVEAGTSALAAAGSAVNAIHPFRVIGSNYKFSLNELKKGKYPRTGIIAKVFGKRRILSMQLDLAHPETFFTAYPKMLIDLLRGKNGPDISKEIEAARAQFADEFAAIAQSKKKVDIQKYKIEEKEAERKKIVAKLEAQAAAELKEIEALDDMKKGEGLYGEEFNVEEGLAMQDRPIDAFNPEKPTSYRAKNRMNHFNWNDKWVLPTPQSGAVTFKVLAQSDVQVGFQANEKAKSKEKLFDIVLGFEGNKSIVIRNEKGEVLTQSTDPTILLSGNKDEEQPFWVSYHNGYIAVGRGNKVGTDLLIDWQLTIPPASVNNFSFSTDENEIELVAITTHPAYEGAFGSRYSCYERFNQFTWHEAFALPIKNQVTLQFKAKAQHDIAIGLTNDSKSKYARYLFSIGLEQNTLTSISHITADGKTYKRIGMTKDKEALVDGDGAEYHDYWITYNKGHLVFGKGTDPSKNIILDTVDEKPVTDISHLSFSSWDNNVEIRDITIKEVVPVKPGTTYSAVNRQFSYQYTDDWLLKAPGKGTIIWQAKGDTDMTVGLHTTKAKVDSKEHTYQVVFGANDNQKTIIYDAAGAELASTNDPEAVIQEVNNYQYYWLSYDNGTPDKPGILVIGLGRLPGRTILLEHEGVTEPITHFAFSNNDGFVQYKNIISQKVTAVPRGRQYTTTPTYSWRPEWQLPVTGDGVVSFKAQGSHDIRVGLHTSQGAPADKTYEVIFGAMGNTRSMIRDHTGTILRADNRHRSKIPDGKNFHRYWIAYNQASKTISYGMNTPIKTDPIISFTLPTAAPISHFSFSSGAPVNMKEITSYKSDDKRLTLKSRNKESVFSSKGAQGAYQWRDDWRFKDADSGTIMFEARTNDTVMIGLHNDPSDRGSKKSYEIRIDKDSATIRDENSVIRAESSHAALGSGGDFFDYWVHYHKGHIIVGSGKLADGANPEDHILLEAVVPNSKRIKGIEYFSFSSNQLPTRYRKVKRGALGRLKRRTCYSAHEQHGSFIFPEEWRLAQQDRGVITFEAKADRDIVIGLADDARVPTYVVVVGANNNKSVSINAGTFTSTDAQSRILRPGHFAPYWLSFINGEIMVGHGSQPGENTIFEWRDPRPGKLMKYFSLSSSNNQVTYRHINSTAITSKGFARRTKFVSSAENKQYDFNDAWHSTRPSYTLQFKAQGKNNIRIGLHSKKSKGRALTYEAVIGARNNTKTLISSGGKVVAEAAGGMSTIMFPDEPSDYWLSYHNGRITVGSGDDPTMNVVASWKDPAPKGVPYFSFSSGDTQVAYSKIKVGKYVKARTVDQFLAHKRGGKYKLREDWRHPSYSDTAFVLSAQGKQEVMIGLAQKVDRQPVYELIVGAENNKTTILKKNGAEVARVPHTIGTGHTTYTYWISNSNGIIRAGLGKTPGEKQFLLWQDEDKIKTRYLALSSNKEMVTYGPITYLSSPIIERDSAYMALAQKGGMRWADSWRVQSGKTLLLDANAPHADIRIGLRRSSTSQPAYTVRIGGWKNTQTAIMKGTKKVASIDRAMKLGEKNVWLTYRYLPDKRTQIIVGTGQPGRKILIDWTDDAPDKEMTSFGLSSGEAPVTYSNMRLVSGVKLASPEEREAEAAKALEESKKLIAAQKAAEEAKADELDLDLDVLNVDMPSGDPSAAMQAELAAI